MRKPRRNPSKQQHDTQESNHPYAAPKLAWRRAAGICEGCGHKPCTCKSKAQVSPLA